jgi:hypothetical protein
VPRLGDRDRRQRGPVGPEAAGQFFGEVDGISERAAVAADQHLETGAEAFGQERGNGLDEPGRSGFLGEPLEKVARLSEGLEHANRVCGRPAGLPAARASNGPNDAPGVCANRRPREPIQDAGSTSPAP